MFREKAHGLFHGRDEETDEILTLWKRVDRALAVDPTGLIGVVDWVSKEYLLGEFCRAERVEWGHPWLESQDLEFHQVDPDKSLGMALADMAGYWAAPRVAEARLEPPSNSRAHARSRLMREIQKNETSYFLDWEAVEVPNQRRTRLLDPFHP
jgi:proteasome accessory factor A